MKLLIALVLLPQLAFGGEYAFKKFVVPDKLKDEARAAGLTGADVECTGDNCILRYNAGVSVNPAPIVAAHVYFDRDAQTALMRTQAIALAKKLKALPEPADPVERDTRRLLLRLCYLWLSQDQ